MTTVVVTRDVNGILIWKPGTEVQLVRMSWYTSDFWGPRQESKNQVWVAKGFFKLLFNEKDTANYFPELLASMEMNTKCEATLNIHKN